jgi:hypothetical protein
MILVFYVNFCNVALMVGSQPRKDLADFRPRKPKSPSAQLTDSRNLVKSCDLSLFVIFIIARTKSATFPQGERRVCLDPV